MPKKSGYGGKVAPTGGALETPGLKSFNEPGGMGSPVTVRNSPVPQERQPSAVGDYKDGRTHVTPRTSVKKGK